MIVVSKAYRQRNQTNPFVSIVTIFSLVAQQISIFFFFFFFVFLEILARRSNSPMLSSRHNRRTKEVDPEQQESR